VIALTEGDFPATRCAAQSHKSARRLKKMNAEFNFTCHMMVSWKLKRQSIFFDVPGTLVRQRSSLTS